jgi:tungstate transport system ATP-binding protein
MSAPVAALQSIRHVRSADFQLEIGELAVGAGEILCLLGPTGAGKSTLLSLLAGLAAAEHGTITLSGQPLNANSPMELRRQLTLVFQRPLMLSGTVRKNVEYGLRLRDQADRPRADELLKAMQLAPLAGRRADALSGGETQLVAIARALAIQPRLLLLDEPTASLDPARVAIVERVVRAAATERGMAVVWATHNLFQARRVADRVALVLDGRLVEAGETHNFFEQPQDSRTADFLAGRYIC